MILLLYCSRENTLHYWYLGAQYWYSNILFNNFSIRILQLRYKNYTIHRNRMYVLLWYVGTVYCDGISTFLNVFFSNPIFES